MSLMKVDKNRLNIKLIFLDFDEIKWSLRINQTFNRLKGLKGKNV